MFASYEAELGDRRGSVRLSCPHRAEPGFDDLRFDYAKE